MENPSLLSRRVKVEVWSRQAAGKRMRDGAGVLAGQELLGTTLLNLDMAVEGIMQVREAE
jgi:hypothetical protein